MSGWDCPKYFYILVFIPHSFLVVLIFLQHVLWKHSMAYKVFYAVALKCCSLVVNCQSSMFPVLFKVSLHLGLASSCLETTGWGGSSNLAKAFEGIKAFVYTLKRRAPKCSPVPRKIVRRPIEK